MTFEEELTSATAPRDVVNAAGAWLGDALASAGFGWVPSSRRLERRLGGLQHQVHLQPSRYNRAGQLIKVGTMLNVREAALRDWRRAHRASALSDDDLICAHLLGYASGRSGGYLYGSAEDGDIDLTEPATRKRRIEAFTAMFREAVLPWFDEASNPELIVASRAGDCTNSPTALVEWLASRSRPELIDAYARRFLARTPPRNTATTPASPPLDPGRPTQRYRAATLPRCWAGQ